MDNRNERVAFMRDIQQVFGRDATGRRVFEEWLKSYHDRMSYTVGCDPLEMAFKEGQRSIILELKTVIEANENDVA
jgi:hypothetical protein